jgi:type IV pilus assembly protein PilC
MADETMSVYEYTALADAATGEKRQGIYRAKSEQEVLDYLLSKGQFPQSIKLKKDSMSFNLAFGGTPYKEIAYALRQLSIQVENGISITSALDNIKSSTESDVLANILAQMAQDTRSGKKLSESMKKYPREFSNLMTSIITAAEEGHLARGLRQVADIAENQVDLKGRIKSALMMPVITLILTLAVAVWLAATLMPSMDSFFKDVSGGKRELPFYSRLLVTMVDNMLPVSIVTLCVVGLIILIHTRAKKIPQYRVFLGRIKLKVPIFGPFLQKMSLTYFTQGLSALLEAGVTLPDSLELTKGIANNAYLELVIDRVKNKVMRGSTLHSALQDDVDIFTPMTVGMVKAGHESGKTAEMLGVVSRFYGKEVKRMSETLEELIEPIITVIIGVVLGYIMFAAFAPIFLEGDIFGG